MIAKKIDKEFLLTDNSVNVYGFRLLTEGYLLNRYKQNPIGYRMHKRDDGVVLRWEDFRVEGDKIFAKPVINLSNPLGEQTADEVENGFLNAASIGGIVVLEFSDAPELMLPGQTGPTVTRWYNKETSLVDVPGNPNALVQLYDAMDKEINLTDFVQQTLKNIDLRPVFNQYLNNDKMEFKKRVLQALNLADNTEDAVVTQTVQDLMARNAKIADLEKNLLDLKAEKEQAEQALANHVKTFNAAKIKELADKAVQDGKITVAVAKDLSDKYADDVDGFKKLVENMPVFPSLVGAINAGKSQLAGWSEKSWDELDKEGKLQDLKDTNLELFKEKYKEKFTKDYV